LQGGVDLSFLDSTYDTKVGLGDFARC